MLHQRYQCDEILQLSFHVRIRIPTKNEQIFTRASHHTKCAIFERFSLQLGVTSNCNENRHGTQLIIYFNFFHEQYQHTRLNERLSVGLYRIFNLIINRSSSICLTLISLILYDSKRHYPSAACVLEFSFHTVPSALRHYGRVCGHWHGDTQRRHETILRLKNLMQPECLSVEMTGKIGYLT